MKLLLHCAECEGELRRPVFAEVESEGVYVAICERGHQFMYTMSNAKFEILFEMALLALNDGYTREAVATLGSAVEEFYRFYVKVVLLKQVLPEETLEGITGLLKGLDRAEPQLGAFAVAYFLEKKKAPPFPDQNSVEFRNRVIHRGRIPKYDEVVSYGDKVLKFLIPLWKEYREGHEHLMAVAMDMIPEIIRKDSENLLKAGTSYPSVLSRLLNDEEPSFRKALDLVKENSFLKK